MDSKKCAIRSLSINAILRFAVSFPVWVVSYVIAMSFVHFPDGSQHDPVDYLIHMKLSDIPVELLFVGTPYIMAYYFLRKLSLASVGLWAIWVGLYEAIFPQLDLWIDAEIFREVHFPGDVIVIPVLFVTILILLPTILPAWLLTKTSRFRERAA